MSGKPNDKWLKTMIKKHGSREAVTRVMQRQGAIGGRNGDTGGFASEKIGADGLTGYERAKIAGRKGGTISRRPSKKNDKD